MKTTTVGELRKLLSSPRLSDTDLVYIFHRHPANIMTVEAAYVSIPAHDPKKNQHHRVLLVEGPESPE